MTTWRKEFESARRWANDQTPVQYIAPGRSALDVEFDDGYGGTEGPPVLIWTADRVYFPAQYDGAEWLDSVPRWPDETSRGKQHVGGG